MFGEGRVQTPPVMPSVGGPPKLRVSSPVSLAGVIVGAPVCADADTSGPFLSTANDRRMKPGRLRAASSSFSIRATAHPSRCAHGTPTFVTPAFASPPLLHQG